MHFQKVHDSVNCRPLHCQMELCWRQNKGSRNMIGKQSIEAALVALCESLQTSCQTNMLRCCSQLLVHACTSMSGQFDTEGQVDDQAFSS